MTDSELKFGHVKTISNEIRSGHSTAHWKDIRTIFDFHEDFKYRKPQQPAHIKLFAEKVKLVKETEYHSIINRICRWFLATKRHLLWACDISSRSLRSLFFMSRRALGQKTSSSTSFQPKQWVTHPKSKITESQHPTAINSRSHKHRF